MKRLSLFLVSVLVLVGVLLAVSHSNTVFAQDQQKQSQQQSGGYDPLNVACQSASGSEICKQNNEQTDKDPVSGPKGIIMKVANFLTVFVGITSVIFIIIGGFKLITSTGDANNVKSARSTIFAAIIGLVVVLLGRAIIIFVIKRMK